MDNSKKKPKSIEDLLSTPKEYIDERSRLQTEAALLFG